VTVVANLQFGLRVLKSLAAKPKPIGGSTDERKPFVDPFENPGPHNLLFVTHLSQTHSLVLYVSLSPALLRS
jgi:hypothetical protein